MRGLALCLRCITWAAVRDFVAAPEVGKEVAEFTSVAAHAHTIKRVSELVKKEGARLVSTVGQRLANSLEGGGVADKP